MKETCYFQIWRVNQQQYHLNLVNTIIFFQQQLEIDFVVIRLEVGGKSKGFLFYFCFRSCRLKGMR